jgi:hypothetical protein
MDAAEEEEEEKLSSSSSSSSSSSTSSSGETAGVMGRMKGQARKQTPVITDAASRRKEAGLSLCKIAA